MTDPSRCPTCNSQGKGGPRLCDDRWHSQPGPPIESVSCRISAAGDSADDTAIELDALATIVGGFEKLPEEARSRVYSYLMSRFPQQRITR